MASRSFDVSGRLGEYELELSGLEAGATLPRVEALSDVVIRYGEMSVDSEPMPLLKSTLQLTFFDPRGRLADQVEAQQLRARLTGPGVDWQGRLTPRRALRPLNWQTKPGNLDLAFYDGIADLKTDANSILASDIDQREQFSRAGDYGRALAFAGNIAEDGLGASADSPGAALASNVEMDNDDNETYGQAGLNSVLAASDYEAESLEDDIKHICATLQCRAFRTLNGGRFTVVPAAQPTGPLPGTRYYFAESDVDPRRQVTGSLTVETEPETIDLSEERFEVFDDDKGSFGFHPFENAGAAEYEVGSEYNLTRNPEFNVDVGEDDGTFPHWTTSTDVDQVTASDTQASQEDAPDGDGMALGSDSGSTETAEQRIGEVSPAGTTSGGLPSGAVLFFDAFKMGSPSQTPALDVTLRLVPDDGSSDVTSTVSDPFGPEQSLQISFDKAGTLYVEASGIEAAWFSPQLQFLEGGKKIAETLIYRDPDSSDRWEVPTAGAARVLRSANVEYWPPTTYRNTSFSVSRTLPWAFNATDRLRRRPVDGTAVRTRVLGLHGPETRIVLVHPVTGEELTFYGGLGRLINLTTGDTEIADVQLPTA